MSAATKTSATTAPTVKTKKKVVTLVGLVEADVRAKKGTVEERCKSKQEKEMGF